MNPAEGDVNTTFCKNHQDTFRNERLANEVWSFKDVFGKITDVLKLYQMFCSKQCRNSRLDQLKPADCPFWDTVEHGRATWPTRRGPACGNKTAHKTLLNASFPGIIRTRELCVQFILNRCKSHGSFKYAYEAKSNSNFGGI